MNRVDFRRRSERKGNELIEFQAHLARLGDVKPTIDNKEPKKHPLSNKKERLKRREYSLIEQNNKILLDRLAKIVQTKTIDNEMSAQTQRHNELKKRLGLIKKREIMQKITEENQRLLERIQITPSAYNHLEWEEDARKYEEYKRTMALYPEYYERMGRTRLTMTPIRGSSRFPPRSPASSPHAHVSRLSSSLPSLRTTFPKL